LEMGVSLTFFAWADLAFPLFLFVFCCHVVLGIKTVASHMLHNYSTTEKHPQPSLFFKF
jgi:hypothetical protein